MITCYQKTGRHHLDRGEPCQDRLCVREDDTHLVLALADGATACVHSRTGARVASETGSDYVLRYGAVLQGCTPKKAAALLLEEIRYHLQRQADREGGDLADYASTLLICRICKKSGDVTVFSLGDDTLFLLGDGKVTPAVRPRRRWGGCPLTVTEDACRAMEMHSLRQGPRERLLLGSDGFVDLFRDRETAVLLRREMGQGNFENIKATIDGLQNMDDCSFLVCGL